MLIFVQVKQAVRSLTGIGTHQQIYEGWPPHVTDTMVRERTLLYNRCHLQPLRDCKLDDPVHHLNVEAAPSNMIPVVGGGVEGGSDTEEYVVDYDMDATPQEDDDSAVLLHMTPERTTRSNARCKHDRTLVRRLAVVAGEGGTSSRAAKIPLIPDDMTSISDAMHCFRQVFESR